MNQIAVLCCFGSAECGTDEWLAEAYEGTAMGGVAQGIDFFMCR